MKQIINRSICLAQWRNGDNTILFNRFVHEDGKLINHYYSFHKKLTLSTIRRIDRILQTYKGQGVNVGNKEERAMISQVWDDVFLMEGKIYPRWGYRSTWDIIDLAQMGKKLEAVLNG